MTPTPSANTIEKTFSFLDAETLEQKEETVAIPFSPATNMEEAMSRLGNNAEKITAALNSAALKSAIKEVKAQIMGRGISKTVLLKTVAAFRSLPPFNSIQDRGEQTKQLFALVKSMPTLFEAVKAASVAASVEDDDNDGE